MRTANKSTATTIMLCLATFCTARAETAPELRLPNSVSPISHRAELTLDPSKEDFSGFIAIKVKINQPVQTIWLNANSISVSEASLRIGGATMKAKAVPGGDEFLGLEFAKAVPAGSGELEIRYQGKVKLRGSAGIFQMEDKDNKYLFTQFESTDARAAFPCFDEPSYKVPWQLSLTFPEGNTAISNTPIEHERKQAGTITYVFKETKPLPSYLIAFAVGPLEYVAAGTAGKNHIPVRIVTPKGHADEAAYAAQVTAEILTRLEDYFGIPYPYEKSDQVAIPTTFGFGAMENAGMVTYGQTILLAAAAHDTTSRQREYVSVAAHELAHQWFGDLVTTAWWNDIWLNEAFATWMEQKLVAEWKPEWNTRVDDVDAKLYAAREDSLVSARKIRQEIKSKDDITNAFDGITYQKGAAVIGMFESYLGQAEFRKGVQSYLRQYAFRTSTAPEFLDAISTSSKRDISKPFSTFLNQAGVPLVSVDLKCGQEGASLHLEQQRFLPLGAKGEGDPAWNIPVCVRYGTDEASERACVMMTQPQQDWTLNANGKAKGCPAWVQANDNAVGYYRVDYHGSLLAALTQGDTGKRLNNAERIDFMGNAQALASAGKLPMGDALKLVETFHDDPDRHVALDALDVALEPKDFVPPELEANYQRFLYKNFDARARQIGWAGGGEESDDVRLLRPDLLPAVAEYAGDKEIVQQGQALADKWFQNHSAVPADMVGAVLRTAAHYGDEKRFEQFLDALKQSNDRQERQQIEIAMISFQDRAAIEAGMRAVLKGEVPFLEAGGYLLVFAGQGSAATRHVPFDFLKSHYDEILAKRPTGGGFDFSTLMPSVGRSFCDAESKAALKSFFEPKVDKLLGAPRSLAQVLEGIDVCMAKKAVQLPSIEAFLRKY